MARGEADGGRLGPFESMLDELEDALEKDKFLGVERAIWPRAAPPPRGEVFVSGAAVASLYVESVAAEPPPEDSLSENSPPESLPPENLPSLPPAPPKKLDLAADFAGLSQELAAARGPDQLRQLRRRWALILHPDRVPPLDRAQAEKFMAEVNAAVDCAIRGQLPSGKRPAGVRP